MGPRIVEDDTSSACTYLVACLTLNEPSGDVYRVVAPVCDGDYLVHQMQLAQHNRSRRVVRLLHYRQLRRRRRKPTRPRVVRTTEGGHGRAASDCT